MYLSSVRKLPQNIGLNGGVDRGIEQTAFAAAPGFLLRVMADTLIV